MSDWTSEALDRLDQLAVKVIGSDGAVTFWNNGSRRLHGPDGREAMGRDYVDLVAPPELRPLLREMIRRCLQTAQTPPACEMRLIGADGGEVIVWSNWVVRDRPGGGRELVVVEVDLTEFKLACQTQAERQRRLFGATKMAMVGDMIGGVSHHVNNALMVIQGSAELIRQGAPDEEMRSLAEQILQTTRQLTQVTGQLMAYTKQAKLATPPVDVHKVVHTVVETLSIDLDPAIELRTDLSAQTHVVMGDEAELHDALMNLGLNACQAITDGGIVTFATDEVELDRAVCDAYPYEVTPGPFLRLTVRDTGVGMDGHTLQRAFEPFFTTRPFGQGHGLGLAGVYGCMKMHRGAMHLTSAPEQGTEAQIFLPLSGAPEAADDARPRSDGAVLVADTDPAMRQAIATILTDGGYPVRVFATGAEAVEYYRTHGQDVALAIVDAALPDMAGHGVLQELKSINGAIDVLVSGGYLLAGDAQAALDDGASGFVTKPYQAAQVLDRVKKVLPPR